MLLKLRSCIFLTTKKSPRKPTAKGTKRRNNCKFLSKFRSATIGSPPEAEILSLVIKKVSGSCPITVKIITTKEPSRYIQKGFL
jgi:hypothetical protein